MPRTPVEKLIPRADSFLVRAFPRVAKRLQSEIHTLDRAEMEAYLKLLPGAVERIQAVTTASEELHDCVVAAIGSLQTTFGSRNASAVESMPPDGNSNAPAELEETTDSVGEPELPNGSDTSQQAEANALPHNGLEAPAGNGGEPGSAHADLHNPRVRTVSRLQGRKAGRRSQRAPGDNANDHD